MKKNLLTRALPLLLAAAPLTHAHAEEQVFSLKPLQVIEDVNGVDLLSGTYRPKLPELSAPAASHLRLDNLQKFLPRMDGKLYRADANNSGKREEYSLNYGGSGAESFVCLDGDCRSAKGNGSGFRGAIGSEVFHYYQGQTDLHIVFNLKSYWKRFGSNDPLSKISDEFSFYPSVMIYPSGESLSFAYDSVPANDGLDHTYHRPTTITSNLGYVMKISYRSNDLASGAWGAVDEAALYKADDMANPVARQKFGSGTMTDELARQWRFSGYSNSLGAAETSRNFTLRKPGIGVNSIVVDSAAVQHGTETYDDWVTSVQRDGVTWNYAYVPATGADAGDAGRPNYSQVTITGPLNYRRVLQLAFTPANHRPYIRSDTDALGKATKYEYDGDARVTKITYPEGNAVQIGYDDYGNITSQRSIAKPGSGLPDIVQTVGYPLTCTRIACFRPLWSRDGMGQQTDYTFDPAHGGLLSKTEPAAANGLRRRTINEYEQYNGIHRLKRTRVCSIYASGANKDCGTATESVTEYTYWQSTFLPLTVTRTNGIGSLKAVTSYAYDSAGNVLSIDGPLAGAADSVYYDYDAAGRRTWEIAGLNAAGRHVATRTTYRSADDQVLATETGTVGSYTDTNLVVSKVERHAYNTHGLKLRTELEAGAVIQALEQYSYDARSRLQCTARRMNPAMFASLPASACSLGTEGSFGPDRIVRNTYDALSRVTMTESGYGTAAAGIDVEIAYTDNGQVASRKDGNGNQTRYTYDGFDRLQRTTFPDGSFEQNGYDMNGNLLTWRKRDGIVLTHQYDGLNLRTLTQIPNESTLNFTYDGLGRPLVTRQGGNSITLAYDGLGRVASSLQNGRSLGYKYDLADRRVRLTYPDGYYVTYLRDATGAVTAIRENGALDLVTYAFDDLGRAVALTRGNGRTTAIAYDSAWRLKSLTHAGINSSSFDYNPASQIIGHAVTSDDFKPRLPNAGTVSYVSNALNQYDAVGGSDYAYDTNGNLTAGGGWTYAYNAHNRLVSASSGGNTLALDYDPNGRLSTSSYNGNATTLLYDGDELIAEYNGSGTMLNRYVHGAGSDDPLVSYSGAATTDKTYLVADERGSIIAEANAAGTVTTTHRYGPFGEPGSMEGSRFRYTGQILLPGTSLYYYKARVYNPAIGRFLQTDPLGYKDGMNWYAYVGNDPLNRVDPDGTISAGLANDLSQALGFANLADANANIGSAIVGGLRGLGTHATEGMQAMGNAVGSALHTVGTYADTLSKGALGVAAATVIADPPVAVAAAGVSGALGRLSVAANTAGDLLTTGTVSGDTQQDAVIEASTKGAGMLLNTVPGGREASVGVDLAVAVAEAASDIADTQHDEQKSSSRSH